MTHGSRTLPQLRVIVVDNALRGDGDVNLRIGNNPAANGTYHLQLEPIAEPAGWRFIRERPGAAVRLGVRKVLYFWGLERDPWTVPEPAALHVGRVLGNVLPLQWSRASMRWALAILFVIGSYLAWRRSPLWVLPAIVAAVMGVHVLYFSAQRFSVPVQPQICLCAALALAACGRWFYVHRRRAVVVAVFLGGWGLLAQTRWMPGTYAEEAEALEGIAARNVADPLASNGVARFGASVVGERPIAFVLSEVFPRGSFVVRVRARAADCTNASAPALRISMRNQAGATRVNASFAVADLCRSPGYNTLVSRGIQRTDDIVDFSVRTMGAVDVYLDRVEVLFGYGRIGDLPVEE